MLTLPLIDICLAIIAECITLQKVWRFAIFEKGILKKRHFAKLEFQEAMREELRTGKRERIRQQSLVGRKLSADNLLVIFYLIFLVWFFSELTGIFLWK